MRLKSGYFFNKLFKDYFFLFFVFVEKMFIFTAYFVLIFLVIEFKAKGHLARKIFRKEKFQTGFVVARGGFFSYWHYQLIKLEEEKRFGLKNNFVNVKRER